MTPDDQCAVMVLDLPARARFHYPTDAALWQEMPGIANSGGTLAPHLAGNVRHFPGAVLGGGGRARPRARVRRAASRAEVVAELEHASSRPNA
jgi:hypothetical protein